MIARGDLGNKHQAHLKYRAYADRVDDFVPTWKEEVKLRPAENQ